MAGLVVAAIGLSAVLSAASAAQGAGAPAGSPTASSAPDGSPTASSAPAPTPEPAGPASAPAAPKEAAAAGAAPVEIAVKSADGFEFKSLYFAPPSAASNAVLVVPDLGQQRDHFARLARTLQERGYRVASMDNAGQTRNVVKRAHGAPLFTPMTTKILLKLVPDVTAAIKALRAQPGVERVAVVGFGIGANAAVLAAGADSTVAGAGLAIPSYGCEEFDPYAAFGDMNSRPVMLLESRKKWISDISDAFEKIRSKRPDLPFEHVRLKRDSEALTQQELEEDYEESVVGWLSKSFPPAAH